MVARAPLALLLLAGTGYARCYQPKPGLARCYQSKCNPRGVATPLYGLGHRSATAVPARGSSKMQGSAQPKVEYLIGPIDTGPARAWLEVHPDLPTPRMVIVGSNELAMTDAAVESFTEFVQDSLDLGQNFSVLWDVRKQSMPTMRHFRMVLSYLSSGDNAAVWDSRVSSHFLVLRNPLLRGIMSVMSRIANAPCAVRFANSDAGALEFAASAGVAAAQTQDKATEPRQRAATESQHRTVAAETMAAPAATVPARERRSKPIHEPLPVRIDDEWYDLGAWRAAHPGGVHWIDGFAGRDATDVMQAFHSDEATSMLSRLPRLRRLSPPSLPQTSELTHGYRRLLAQLRRDGWYERVWWKEAQSVAPILVLYAAGTALARRCSLLATLLLALGSTGAGWVAHDFVHGRGPWCAAMRGFGAICNGHSATWWSNKVYSQEQGPNGHGRAAHVKRRRGAALPS